MMSIESATIIEINKTIIQAWNQRHKDQQEAFDVSLPRIEEVLDIVKNIGNDLAFTESAIVKASYLIGGLAWSQPFSGANKRTAVLSGTLFLYRNQFRLSITKNQKEIRELLYEIQDERSKLNPETMDKIILYIKTNTSEI